MGLLEVTKGGGGNLQGRRQVAIVLNFYGAHTSWLRLGRQRGVAGVGAEPKRQQIAAARRAGRLHRAPAGARSVGRAHVHTPEEGLQGGGQQPAAKRLAEGAKRELQGRPEGQPRTV